MLGDRQQLDMGEAHLLDVGDQARGEFAVGEVAVALLRHPGPRAQVDLVDRDRAVAVVDGVAALHPGAVAPGELGQAFEPGGGLGRLLGREGDRIRLERQERAVGSAHLELVVPAPLQFGDEQFPDAAILPQPHRVASAVPVVEVADDRDAAGVRRPDREAEARRAADLDLLGAQHPVHGVVADVAQEADLLLVQGGAVLVGVAPQALGVVPALDRDAVIGPLRVREAGDEEAGRVAPLHRHAGIADDDRGGAGLRQHRADLPLALGRLVRAQHRERVAVLGPHHRLDGVGMDRVGAAGHRGTGGPARGRARDAGRGRRLHGGDAQRYGLAGGRAPARRLGDRGLCGRVGRCRGGRHGLGRARLRRAGGRAPASGRLPGAGLVVHGSRTSPSGFSSTWSGGSHHPATTGIDAGDASAGRRPRGVSRPGWPGRRGPESRSSPGGCWPRSRSRRAPSAAGRAAADVPASPHR